MKKLPILNLVSIILIIIIFGAILKWAINSYVESKAFRFLLTGIYRIAFIIGCIMFLWRKKLIIFPNLNRNWILVGVISILLLSASVMGTELKIEAQDLPVSSFEHYAYLFSCLSVGFFEEIFVRVLIFAMICNITQPNEKSLLVREVLITSCLFGFLHVTNLFNSSYDWIGVAIQILFAIILGIILQSILVRFRNIWLIGVLHTLFNYFGMRNTKLFGIVSTAEDSTRIQDLIDSLLTILVIAVITLPFCYYMLYSARKREYHFVSSVNTN